MLFFRSCSPKNNLILGGPAELVDLDLPRPSLAAAAALVAGPTRRPSAVAPAATPAATPALPSAFAILPPDLSPEVCRRAATHPEPSSLPADVSVRQALTAVTYFPPLTWYPSVGQRVWVHPGGVVRKAVLLFAPLTLLALVRSCPRCVW